MLAFKVLSVACLLSVVWLYFDNRDAPEIRWLVHIICVTLFTFFVLLICIIIEGTNHEKDNHRSVTVNDRCYC